MDTTRISVTIPTKLAERIKSIGESEHRSMSNQTTALLYDAVERYTAEQIERSIEAMKGDQA